MIKFKEVTEITSKFELTSKITEYREESSFRELVRSAIRQNEDFVDACPEYEIGGIYLDYTSQYIEISINNTKDLDKDESIEIKITPVE